MLGNVFGSLFGCGHKNYSFPITAKKGSVPKCEAARVTGTYVVCLDCGQEFPYDWNRMKVVSASAGKISPVRVSPAADAHTEVAKVA
jgi:hypothetical protein